MKYHNVFQYQRFALAAMHHDERSSQISVAHHTEDKRRIHRGRMNKNKETNVVFREENCFRIQHF